MKKTLFLIFCIFTFLLKADSSFLENTSLVDLSKEEKLFLFENHISCVVTDNWAPFNFKKENKIVGISVDYWELIKNKTLIDSTCISVEHYNDAIELLNDKRIHVVLSAAIKKNNNNNGYFSKSFTSYPIAIATTLDKQYISDTELLNNRKVAISASYTSYEVLKEKYPKIKFIEAKSNLEALKMLSKHEVYAVIDVLPVLTNLIAHKGFNNLKISGTTQFEFELGILVRKDHETLLNIINKAISSISLKEENKIKNKWASVRFENSVDYTKFLELILIVLVVFLILFYRQFILNRHNKKLQEANDEIEKKTKELENKTSQLTKQKELFEKIYHESADGIILMQLETNEILDCNDSALKLLKYKDKSEFISLSIIDILPTKQLSGLSSVFTFYKMLDILNERGSYSFEFIFKNKFNKNIWLEIVLTTIVIDEKNIIHMVLRDINERKEMEVKLNDLTHTLEHKVRQELRKNEEKTKQLIQQSRLAQMGEMISMIAHQWRQPLTAISATTNNLLLRMMIKDRPDDNELSKEITLISEYSQHLSNTIDDFRNFFKSDKEKSIVTLEEVISNSISIIKNSLETNEITLKTDFKCNETVEIFASELNQVILNLIKNAEDSILDNKIENGVIEIKTKLDNNICNIFISDNGGGVPSDIIDKIFDPYFSTKKSKEGTGLGLYMSKIIVEDHCKGKILVENNSKGTVFTVKIPIE